MKHALTIAGSDSIAGAGIQQDMKVFSALGVHGMCALTAVTAQNSRGVYDIRFMDPLIVEQQVDVVLSDTGADAVKTGMLGSPAVIKAVIKKVKEYNLKNLVVDPVMVSTTGQVLVDVPPDDGIKDYKNKTDDAAPESDDCIFEHFKELISLCRICTLNIDEAMIFTGRVLNNVQDMQSAAHQVCRWGAENCIITNEGLDVLCTACESGDNKAITLRSETLSDIVGFHGTGCTFSAALTAYLAADRGLIDAVKSAKKITENSIRYGFKFNSEGLSLLNPFFDIERAVVLSDVNEAVKKITANDAISCLCPEVGINVAMALSYAGSIKEVAGVSGRIVNVSGRMKTAGEVVFGGSSHIGRVVLTAMMHDPEKRGAMNIKFSDNILEICRKLNLEISGFERSDLPDDNMTMQQGTSYAIEKKGNVPDIIYDRGGVGKEPMIRIISESASRACDIALVIAYEYKKRYDD